LSELPDKQYFKIGEVSRILGVKPHVLRYWESEFSSIRPQKSRTNQRLYRRRDVELLVQIKQLLYQEGFTIAGANKRLRELLRSQRDEGELVDVLREVREQVDELLQLVEEDELASAKSDTAGT
jgi:DNA-binding transcriptional MerR regulator